MIYEQLKILHYSDKHTFIVMRVGWSVQNDDVKSVLAHCMLISYAGWVLKGSIYTGLFQLFSLVSNDIIGYSIECQIRT